ncbi:MAG TPA: PspA/IM30 family protein [Acidimicrobiales bacterium]|nr:PspA/IM30 family protein [Acidimicrobiales bacterium]
MLKTLKRMWRYMSASLSSKFDEKADPKIQLEQAIAEAQDQHRKLTEQAANIIANNKQAEIKLNRAMEELEKTTSSARQAVIMADEASKKGDHARAGELTRAAEAFANRLVAKEEEISSLKALILQSADAAAKARQAVATNSSALQSKLTERQKLLSQLDQAKMQEQMNVAMESLSESVGQPVPSLEEVRNKIEARYAKALGVSELKALPIEAGLIEVSQAQMQMEAQSKLEEIRRQIGLSPPSVSGSSVTGQLAQPPAPGVLDAPAVSPSVQSDAQPQGQATTTDSTSAEPADAEST